MEITMWIWICAGLAVLCSALFLLFLVNSMNFVHLAKPKQSLVKQSMFSWLLLVMCGGWVAVAILLNIALQTQLT